MNNLNQPRITAVATATPPDRFTQEEVLQMAGYTRPIARDIFMNSDIDYRYLYVNPATDHPGEDLDKLHRRYREGAALIARQAAERSLEKAGLTTDDVDCILVCSCTGYLCPDLSTVLVKEMGLASRVQRGALLGLQRAYDHARAYPDHRVLMVAVEICSAAYYIDDTLETLIGNAICADGAAACIITCRDDAGGDGHPGPRIRSFASVLDPNCQSSVGFEQRQGYLRIILAPTIRDLAPPIIDRALDELLPPEGVERSGIRHWGLSDDDVAVSRHVLRNYGNMSSPTVLFVLNEFMKNGDAKAGDLGVMLALGPGFAAEAALLEW
jgi:predicted naringenin-chalcone synthase